MAAGNSFFNHEVVAPTFAADGPGLERYFAASSGHGGFRFQKAAGAPAGVPDVGSLVAGIGMAPASFVMPEGALAAAGYGAMGVVQVPVSVAVVRQPRAGTNDGETVPFKGAWTKEEDEILKEMVNVYGDRKWAMIAQSLPGRIGKQCRERWTNHLRPDIKKDVWTEEDDRALIEAHKCYGNRWSAISRCLPGRSENAVKNHWNATKRSLKSKRRLKKKKSEQAAPGEFTTLEDYIRSKCPADEPTEPPPPVSAPPSNNLGYHTLVGPTADVQPTSSMIPPGMGMYLSPGSSAGSSHLGMAAHLNMPAMPTLNAYGQLPREYSLPSLVTPDNLRYGVLHAPAPRDMHVAHANLNTYPFVAENLAGNVEFECRSSNRANVGGHYGEVGPSSTGGGSDPDDIDVVHMASREFLTLCENEATLDLTRFL